MFRLRPIQHSLRGSWVLLIRYHPEKVIQQFPRTNHQRKLLKNATYHSTSEIAWTGFFEECLRAPSEYKWKTAALAMGMAAPPILSIIDMHFSPLLAAGQATIAISFMLYVSAKKWAFKHLSKHRFSLLTGLAGTGVQIVTPLALTAGGFMVFGYPLNTLGLGTAMALQAFFDATNPSYTRPYKSIRIFGATVACFCLLLMAFVHQAISDAPVVRIFSPMVEDVYFASSASPVPAPPPELTNNDHHQLARPTPPYLTRPAEDTSSEIFSVVNEDDIRPSRLLGRKRNILKLVSFCSSSAGPMSPDDWELKWEILRENVERELRRTHPKPDSTRIPPGEELEPHFPPAVDPAPLVERFGLRDD